jgi:hypothetical protein
LPQPRFMGSISILSFHLHIPLPLVTCLHLPRLGLFLCISTFSHPCYIPYQSHPRPSYTTGHVLEECKL